jgi:hypothetical protein
MSPPLPTPESTPERGGDARPKRRRSAGSVAQPLGRRSAEEMFQGAGEAHPGLRARDGDYEERLEQDE